MSYRLPPFHSMSHLLLLSSDLILALKHQQKKRLKPLKNYLFEMVKIPAEILIMMVRPILCDSD